MDIDKHISVFRRSLPYRLKFGEIIRLLDSTDNENCLSIVADETMISYHLHQRGGTWHGLAFTETAAEVVKASSTEDVEIFDGKAFPFDDKVFDVVVLLDLLERVRDDVAFVTECHRVLKPAGRLVLCVPHAKNWSAVRPIRSLVGMTSEKRGWTRRGYTETQLFRVLKDGFDVHYVNSYSRFFLECVDAIARALRGKMSIDDQDPGEKSARFHAWAYPFFWVAYQLDMLIFFTRGYHLVASAKRRAWLPRKTPVLSDGRSITEAVLTKIKE